MALRYIFYMANKKQKTDNSKKRKSNLSSPTEIVADFIAGMSSDKEVIKGLSSLSESHFRKKIRGVVSTQSATLDAAIGRGGVPMSRITILHGKEGSGKTTLALHLVAEAQRRGGLGLYIDKEYKLDPDYVESLGVDSKRLFIPEEMKTLEDVIPQIKATLRRAKEIRKKTKNPVPIVIVIDSLNACKAFETIETPTGKKRYPAEARIWSEELPGIVDMLSEEYVSLVFISQVRKKMNVQFGNDEEMAGGFAPRFFASLIIYIARTGTEKDANKNKTGSKIETECRKNQISPPFKKADFVIYWSRGIDYEHSLVLQLEKLGIAKKMAKTKTRKAGIVIGEKVIGRTHVKSAENIRKNPKLREKLRKILHKRMKWDDPI